MKFWGTRGSIPTPGPTTHRYGGNTACLEVRAGDALFICDGGTGLRELGLDLIRRHQGTPIVGHMLFSHPHWDHIQGFPFFTPAYQPENVFHIYGTPKGDRRLFGLVSGQMRSDYFPVDFSELSARILAEDLEEERIEGVKVRALPQCHPGGSFAFSFEAGGRKVVYATDNELDEILLNREESLRDLEAPRRFPQELLDFVRGADLLVADGQYCDEEYPSKIGWGHPRATTTVDLAAAAGVKQLAITHHDPMQSDAEVDEKIAACVRRASRLAPGLVVFGAREGAQFEVP
ncbi:MBL fold metallo-hydrolase [Vulgatibacter incomptus]|uniref:MBL fold metallo-hydrolase n=1 Tax=Vulgatibacter incomptus TaxID=1391653 RepID=UPI0006816269|nr:MBL fold metallo-hydrolase [Vulgatibacter incomptus]